MTNMDIIIVGAGPMGIEYGNVLNSMGVQYSAICRSEQTAVRFTKTCGANCFSSTDLAFFLSERPTPKFAIVATPVESLSSVCMVLIKAGVQNILLEKPGALYEAELAELSQAADDAGTRVFIAYNRRFFGSVIKLRELALEDGGISALEFNFTEWSDRISPLKKGPGVKERWVLSNSTHVIDLAFFLAGRPAEISTFTAGSVDWHKASSTFAGAGKTEKGILFSYLATWDSAGRWGVTAYSENYKFELCPMEKLFVTSRNSVESVEIECSQSGYSNLKPGLFGQVDRFLSGRHEELCSLAEHVKNFKNYEIIAGY